MTTFYTANRNYPKPDFDSAAWHVQMNQALDMIDLDTAAYFMSPSLVVEAWTQNTAYNLNDKVLDIPRNQLFLCEVGHTSGGDFLADRTAHPDWWSAFGVPLVPRGQWANGVIYHVLDHVYDNVQGIIALCSIAHTSAPTGTIKGPSEIGNWLFVADNSTLIVSINNSAAAAANSASQAANSASAASASAASALSSKNAAANSEANSAGYATNASAYATSAGNSASAASASATAAANSATNASTSATNAANSATAAAASAASVPGPSNAAPLMNGSAVPGVAALVSRGDHVHPSDTSRVAKAGDTMAGDLTITNTNPALWLNMTGSPQFAGLYGEKAGLKRWGLFLGDGATESSGNAGTNFALSRFDDAGNSIDSPISINRASGLVNTSIGLAEAGVALAAKYAGLGTLINAMFFNATQAYTPSVGAKSVLVLLLGGGGGGGGVGATVGNGVAGNAYCGELRCGVFPATPVTVTIGAAGNGGGPGNVSGTPGGASTWGASPTPMIAAGAGGGGGSNGATSPGSGSYNTGSGGSFAMPLIDFPRAALTNGLMWSQGGSAWFGSGGQTLTGATVLNGQTAGGYGGGGNGAMHLGVATTGAGGDGGPGMAWVLEFK